jgi:hypothetical protein
MSKPSPEELSASIQQTANGRFQVDLKCTGMALPMRTNLVAVDADELLAQLRTFFVDRELPK